jgi:hypothetical protein
MAGTDQLSAVFSALADLIYMTNVSFDGYIEDEVFAFTTDLLRSTGGCAKYLPHALSHRLTMP